MKTLFWDDRRINRITKGVFELGSTFKAFTIAMALDEQVATLDSTYDARTPIRIGRHSIGDYHPENRVLSVREVFIHSSNIGSAKIALQAGGMAACSCSNRCWSSGSSSHGCQIAWYLLAPCTLGPCTSPGTKRCRASKLSRNRPPCCQKRRSAPWATWDGVPVGPGNVTRRRSAFWGVKP